MEDFNKLQNDYVDKLCESLEYVCETLIKLNRSVSSVGGLYGELLVMSKLFKYCPQCGPEREKKSADIFLKKINKRVEVKLSKPNPHTLKGYENKTFWGWGFGKGIQITKKKFDYCILISLNNKAEPEHFFVIPRKNISKLTGRKGGIPLGENRYYIRFYEDYELAKKIGKDYWFFDNPFERKLNKKVV